MVRVERRTKTINDSIYICEKCELHYSSQSQAENCEKVHACDHKDSSYEAESVYTYLADIGIVKRCNNCGKFLGSAELNADEIPQSILEELYRLAKQ